MNNKAAIDLWLEGRSRFENVLEKCEETDLSRKLENVPNSIGFLIRHIAEIELLFAKNIFGNEKVKVKARTLIDGKDTGEWTDLEDLKKYQEEAKTALKTAIENVSDWEEEIHTKEFGTKSKIAAFGRLVTHSAYHAGQMNLILKYAAK